MKSLYDIINETKNIEYVWIVKGPDGSIASVWPSKEEADDDALKFNQEVKGDVFTVERYEASEFVKS